MQGAVTDSAASPVAAISDPLQPAPLSLHGADRTLATGKMIDSYLSQKSDLDDRAIHLLFSANRWERAYVLFLPQVPVSLDSGHWTRGVSFFLIAYSTSSPIRSTQILEDLDRGRTVVCDRYAFSGIAFSVIKVRTSLAASLPLAKNRSPNPKLSEKLKC